MTAKTPYSFLRSAHVEFFDEGTWQADGLLTRPCDSALAFGAVERMVVAARAALADVPEEAVRPMLWLGDWLVEAAAQEGVLRVEGEPVEWNTTIARGVDHLAVLRLVLRPLAEQPIWIQDEDGEFQPIEVTPPRFCAAFILRSVFSAIDFGYVNGLDDLPICYLLNASAVYGHLVVMQQEDPSGVRGVLGRDMRKANATSLAIKRWANDPQRAMWVEVREAWENWTKNRKELPKPSDFRREMQLRYGVVDGTLKNKMSLWERQRRNDAGIVSSCTLSDQDE